MAVMVSVTVNDQAALQVPSLRTGPSTPLASQSTLRATASTVTTTSTTV